MNNPQIVPSTPQPAEVNAAIAVNASNPTGTATVQFRSCSILDGHHEQSASYYTEQFELAGIFEST